MRCSAPDKPRKHVCDSADRFSVLGNHTETFIHPPCKGCSHRYREQKLPPLPLTTLNLSTVMTLKNVFLARIPDVFKQISWNHCGMGHVFSYKPVQGGLRGFGTRSLLQFAFHRDFPVILCRTLHPSHTACLRAVQHKLMPSTVFSVTELSWLRLRSSCNAKTLITLLATDMVCCGNKLACFSNEELMICSVLCTAGLFSCWVFFPKTVLTLLLHILIAQLIILLKPNYKIWRQTSEEL